jgi:hypothetical protein
MRVTLTMSKDIHAACKQLAKEQGRMLSAVVEDALRVGMIPREGQPVRPPAGSASLSTPTRCVWR